MVMRPSMIVTFAHHKGGTGKTTTCTSVAGELAKQGRRVLVVDMDPQANATAGLGVDVSTVKAGMVDVLTGGLAMRDILLETESGVHLAPATLDLIGAEPALYARQEDRVLQLARALAALDGFHDHVLVDTPPGAGVLMLNGLAAADEVVVALDPGVFAIEELRTLDTIFDDLAHHAGRHPRVRTAVLSRAVRPGVVDRLLSRADPVSEMIPDLRARFPHLHIVPYDRAVFEAQRRGLPLSHVSPDSPAARVFRALAQELIADG